MLQRMNQGRLTHLPLSLMSNGRKFKHMQCFLVNTFVRYNFVLHICEHLITVSE